MPSDAFAREMAPQTIDRANQVTIGLAEELASGVLDLAGCLATAGITLPAEVAARVADLTSLAADVKNQIGDRGRDSLCSPKEEDEVVELDDDSSDSVRLGLTGQPLSADERVARYTTWCDQLWADDEEELGYLVKASAVMIVRGRAAVDSKTEEKEDGSSPVPLNVDAGAGGSFRPPPSSHPETHDEATVFEDRGRQTDCGSELREITFRELKVTGKSIAAGDGCLQMAGDLLKSSNWPESGVDLQPRGIPSPTGSQLLQAARQTHCSLNTYKRFNTWYPSAVTCISTTVVSQVCCKPSPLKYFVAGAVAPVPRSPKSPPKKHLPLGHLFPGSTADTAYREQIMHPIPGFTWPPVPNLWLHQRLRQGVRGSTTYELVTEGNRHPVYVLFRPRNGVSAVIYPPSGQERAAAPRRLSTGSGEVLRRYGQGMISCVKDLVRRCWIGVLRVISGSLGND
ncbi:hypothetical protein V8F20_001258 [Naviculisporaceae sp. PSN 640]